MDNLKTYWTSLRHFRQVADILDKFETLQHKPFLDRLRTSLEKLGIFSDKFLENFRQISVWDSFIQSGYIVTTNSSFAKQYY